MKIGSAVLSLALVAVVQTHVWAVPNPLTPTGRNVFVENECIELVVPAAGHVANVVLTEAAGVKRAVDVPVVGGAAHVMLQPLALSPGEWTISAGGVKSSITVVSSIRNTPYTFLNYQGWLDEQAEIWGPMMKGSSVATGDERVRIWRDDFGINVLQLQNGGVPMGARTMDLILQMGARFTTLNTAAGQHQPGGGMFDWSMPEVQVATRRQVQHAAQVLRRYPGFLGVHYADEPGLTYGTRNPNGSFEPFNGTVPDPKTHYFGPLAVPAQFELYTRTMGQSLPDLFNPRSNLSAWLEYMRFRCRILGNVFAQYTADVHAIDPSLIGYSQIYAWMFLIDGEYPPDNTKGVDVISTHAYIDHALGLWYPVHEADAMRDGDWGKPLWMMPSFEGMIRKPTLYASVARKLEGLGWDRATMAGDAQAREVAHRIVPISGMLYQTTKPRDAVAIFYSRDQYLVETARNIKDLTAGRDYASHLVAAWIMCNALQIPAVRVVEEDLLAGLPVEHKVIIAPQLTYLRPENRKALEKFIAAGGVLVLDKASTVEIPGARKLSFEIVNWWGETVPGDPDYEGLTQGQIFSKHVIPVLPELKRLLQGKVSPLVETDTPWLLASRQVAGKGDYVWLVNMKHTTTTEYQPLSASVRLPDAPAIYDVFKQGLISSPSIHLDLSGGDAALYALMPDKVAGVTLALQALPGRIKLTATVMGASKVMVDAVIPLELELRDPAGTLIKRFYRATQHGQYVEELPLGNAPAKGDYGVQVTELLGHAGAAAKVKPLESLERFARSDIADVDDVARITATVASLAGKKMLVLYGETGQRPVAERVAAVLGSKRIKAVVDRAAPHDTLRKGWINSLFYTAGIYTDAAEIGEPAVLIGSKANNPLTKRVVEALLVPRPLSDKVPGEGRGMVYWARSILGLNKDLILLYANDAEGLDRAVKAFETTLQNGVPPMTELNAK